MNDEFTFLSTQQEFFGVLKGGFLARSIGSLDPKRPLIVDENTTVGVVLSLFQLHRIGSMVVVGAEGTLTGIFTERDYVLKCAGKESETLEQPISAFMTRDPVAQPPDTTIAFVISLMVHGGFRHIPIIDEANKPIGILSVKDIMAAIGQQFLDDIDNI